MSADHPDQADTNAVILPAAGKFPGPVPAPKDDSTPLRVFITGASRGLGLELARQYAHANAKNVVFAGARDVTAAPLAALVKQYPNIHPIQCDTTDDASIERAAAQVSKKTDALDLLINNAGITSRDRPSNALHATRADFNAVVNVNVSGHVVVTQRFLPLLKASRGAIADKYPAKVVFVSSALGSISVATLLLGMLPLDIQSVPYMASKAALNMTTAAFAHAEPTIGFYAVHPGWVKTDMGSQHAPVEIEDSVQAQRALYESRTLAHTGKFFDIIGFGNELPF